jgi:hypothetical protein
MGELVDTRRYGRQLLSFLRSLPDEPAITIGYNRRDTSRVRGYRNVTVKTALLEPASAPDLASG